MNNIVFMKTPKLIKFMDIFKSVRKQGGRASIAFTSKKAKGRSQRNLWKKEQLA